ncbi:terminase family protein [Haloarcula quadrata]|uniref:Terminase family protein n=1 Tax=Haloarcula quadrata TaxID=182779 RepID=A0A495R7L0_9EURY|nr:terminase family protein [Haloarcula quadrata]
MPVSSPVDAGAIADVATGQALDAKRQTLNPFEGPATWVDFANELTRNYMAGEMDDDPYHLLDEHHGHWLEKFDAGDRVLLCHRDGLKTTITLAYLIACLEYKPGFRAIWAMNNETSVTKKADTEFWKMVNRNPWLTSLNAPPKKDNIQTKIFENGSTLTAGWLFGGIEGDRAHLLVLDDIIKEKGDGSTDDVLDWVEAVSVPMVKDNGRTVVIGTRKQTDDIYQNFRLRDGYDVDEFPAILDYWDQQFSADDDWQARRPDDDLYTEVEDPWNEGETLQVLWPEARGPEWLADKRSKMADHRFWREYSLVIMGSSGDLIDAKDVRLPAEDGGCSITDRDPPPKYRAGPGEVVILSHDPANSPTGDDAAFTVWLLQRDGRRRLLDCHAEAGMSPSDVKTTLVEYDRRYDPAIVVVENNGMQSYVAEDAIEFDAQLGAKVTGIPTTGAKHSWDNGIPRLRILVENGRILFHRGHRPTEDFITAMQSLERRDGKLHGHTPDYIAAWYMAEKGLRKLEDMGITEIDDMPDADEDEEDDESTDSGLYGA